MVREKGEDQALGMAEAIEPPPPPPPPEPRLLSLAAGADEALAQLWGSVFLSPERAAPKSVVLTSAESGEGVTHIAAGLALIGSSSAHGLRIALVDFNIQRPKLAELFDIQTMPGVAEVIAQQATLDEALVRPQARSGTEFLEVLPAGLAEHAPLTLLRSKRVGELLRQLADTHDHVIIDAPAVNRQATAQTLAGFADGVLLVVKAGATRRESVAEAKKRIEYAQGKVLGVVLNQRQFPIPGFLYRRL